MNPKIKQFQQILLGGCIGGAFIGIFMMFFTQNSSGTGLMWFMTSLGVANIPLFYFASQVAFQPRSDSRKNRSIRPGTNPSSTKSGERVLANLDDIKAKRRRKHI